MDSETTTPTVPEPDYPLSRIASWRKAGQATALATVVQTWGSAPRPVGSWLAVRDDGAFEGSVSGGCVEAAVVAEAQQAIHSGKHRLLTFGVTDDEAWEVGLACGGTIRVLVQPLAADDPLPEQMVEAMAARQPVRLWTDLTTGARAWQIGTDSPDSSPNGPAASATGPLAETGRPLPLLPKSGPVDADAPEGVFLHRIDPPVRLAIVGGVHIAQALAPMAALIGLDVTLIDPRPHWANADRFPNVRLLAQWPDEGLTHLGVDAQTAVVTLTHDAKFDDPALTTALASPAFYIGALGSTRTHAKRLDRLRAAGVAEEQLSRLHAPVGLDIGALSPAEIALSILGEITRVRRKGA